MVKLSLALLLGFTFLVVAPTASAQTCAPSNVYTPYTPAINYVANGDPVSTDCWSVFNASVGYSTMSCGFYPQWSLNNFEFGYGGDVAQTFTITPTDTTVTSYTLAFFADFQDPNHDPAFNQLNIDVYDSTAHRTLASFHYDGSQPDLFCARRDITVYNGNLAGHSLTVRLMGSTAYATTHIRVGQIQLVGS